MDEVKLPGHHHPLILRKFLMQIGFECDWCSTKEFANEWYYCNIYKCDFGRQCVELPREINHPLHLRHPLVLFAVCVLNGTNKLCRLCGEDDSNLVYHCSFCDFSVDMCCAWNPPEVAIDNPKSHEHTLTLIPREISFNCTACGEVGSRSPYVCARCDFMVHKDCIYLSCVIKINRHKHRISRTYFLGPGNWVCGVCRQEIDGKYGAYSCSVCSYAVHTKCATRIDVWNKIELEGIPEETDQIEVVKPFKMINDKVINHFSHEHDLRLNKKGSICDERKLCHACVLPIWFSPFYSCMQCDFILHQICVNLPKKKLHELFVETLSLHANDEDSQGVFHCYACSQLCSGFRYEHDYMKIDVRRGSISEPFIHEGHPHPLFFTLGFQFLTFMLCMACGGTVNCVLNCVECDFVLCLECANLPRMVRHKYDEHPVILRLGEDVSGSYWCDICEEELDPKKRFYACDECGFTSHVKCVLGCFPVVKPGHRFSYGGVKFEAIQNNGTSRPLCWFCKRRCQFPSIIKSLEDADTHLFSRRCLDKFIYWTMRDHADEANVGM